MGKKVGYSVFLASLNRRLSEREREREKGGEDIISELVQPNDTFPR